MSPPLAICREFAGRISPAIDRDDGQDSWAPSRHSSHPGEYLVVFFGGGCVLSLFRFFTRTLPVFVFSFFRRRLFGFFHKSSSWNFPLQCSALLIRNVSPPKPTLWELISCRIILIFEARRTRQKARAQKYENKSLWKQFRAIYLPSATGRPGLCSRSFPSFGVCGV